MNNLEQLLDDHPLENWQELFPLKDFRKYQEPALQAIINGFAKGKRYAIIEGPTGCGKTALAITLARLFSRTFLATHQKMLQSQYMRDFSEYLSELKGRSNYPCLRINFESWSVKTDDGGGYIRQPDLLVDYIEYENWEQAEEGHVYRRYNCANAPCCTQGATQGRKLKAECKSAGICEYMNVRDHAMADKSTIMNFSNLLLFSLMMPKVYKQRSLLILDEAHTFERFLYDYTTISLTIPALKPLIPHDTDDTVFRLSMPFKGVPDLVDYIEHRLLPLIEQYLKASAIIHGESEKDDEDEDNADEFSSTENERDRLQKLATNLKKLLKEEPSDHSHVIVPTSELDGLRKKAIGIQVKPFSVAHLGPAIGFRSAVAHGKVVLMSATILDSSVFCESLGIPQDEAFFIRIPSTFPPENRPIIGDVTVGSMSYKDKEVTLPKMCDRILELTDHYHADKGIIHTGNYEIMHKLKKWAKQHHPDLHDRILFQATGTYAEKSKMLQVHTESREPLILCGPGFTEGLDLKDDLARFNLIMKLPFLSLADPLIKRKAEEHPKWYTLQMLLALIQAIGRIIRSPTDTGTTYILDKLWQWIFQKEKKSIPPYLLASIKWRSDRNLDEFP